MSDETERKWKKAMATTLRDVAARIDGKGKHACAGWDCATCEPAQDAEEIRLIANELDPSGDA